MLALYKTRFRVDPEPTYNLTEVANDCVRFIDLWVARTYEKIRKYEGDAPPFEGVRRVDDLDRSLDQPQLQCTELSSGAFLHSFYWGRRDSKDGHSRWVSLVDLVSDGRVADFQYQLGIESEAVQLEASRRQTGPPRLIALLLSHPRWTCRSGDQKLSIEPLKITFREVETLCNDSLFSAERDLPVVVITPDAQGRRYPVDPGVLAQRLGGTAKVVQLRDSLTVQVLDEFLGRPLGIGTNAVRVLGPGVVPGGSLEGHWHFLGETIRGKRLSDQDFSNFLFSRLAERALPRFHDSPLFARFRQMAETERIQKLESLRDQSRVDQEFYDTYAKELEVQNRQLESEVRSQRQQIEQLQAELAAANDNVLTLARASGQPEVELAEAPAEPEVPRTVVEIVRDAAERFTDLVILDSALDSADEVPLNYKFPDRVAKALEALQDGSSERRKTGRMPRGWKAYFEVKGFEYKVLSDRTKNTWGEDYTFLCEGERVLFEEHFTIGVRDANTCLSIHFSTRQREDKIIVGYVGRHLRNTQT